MNRLVHSVPLRLRDRIIVLYPVLKMPTVLEKRPNEVLEFDVIRVGYRFDPVKEATYAI